MNLRKAAEAVLEAFDWDWSEPRNKALRERMKALRQALEQPEQEPVGYVTIENISSWAQVPSIKWFKKPTEGPLYTAPPKREWVGLTNEEVWLWFQENTVLNKESATRIYQAIEAKLKEKNT